MANRELRMIIIADVNNAESRELIPLLNTNPQISQTLITPQAVKNILPGIRATPAVGVLFWATDLQGIASDVDAFASYIRDEVANKQAIADGEDIAQAYVDMLADSITTENGLEE